MQPTCASSGKEALELLRAAHREGRQYSLVLLDVNMPAMDGFAVAREMRESPTTAAVPIMMLSSSGQLDESAKCRELGIATYLTKPVEQRQLRSAIVTALGRVTAAPQPVAASLTSPDPAPQRLEILLAEDNRVNQLLAETLLKRRGHHVTTAPDGRQAVAAIEKRTFDVVLMDVQMPEMGGFEATAAIRAREQGTGARVPIVAMTAHALTGDRQRCLDAGMDDYVSKPLSAATLLDAIERVIAAGRAGTEQRYAAVQV